MSAIADSVQRSFGKGSPRFYAQLGWFHVKHPLRAGRVFAEKEAMFHVKRLDC